MPVCFDCGGELVVSGKPGRAETCPFCDADMHCCRNCEFYDSAVYNECREPQAERVLEKDRSNFCDYFSFRKTSANSGKAAATGGTKKNPLDGLFKK